MIANYQQPGAAIDYTNPTSNTIKAGQVVSLTTRIGVAGTEIPAAAVGSLHVKAFLPWTKPPAQSPSALPFTTTHRPTRSPLPPAAPSPQAGPLPQQSLRMSLFRFALVKEATP